MYEGRGGAVDANDDAFVNPIDKNLLCNFPSLIFLFISIHTINSTLLSIEDDMNWIKSLRKASLRQSDLLIILK